MPLIAGETPGQQPAGKEENYGRGRETERHGERWEIELIAGLTTGRRCEMPEADLAALLAAGSKAQITACTGPGGTGHPGDRRSGHVAQIVRWPGTGMRACLRCRCTAARFCDRRSVGIFRASHARHNGELR